MFKQSLPSIEKFAAFLDGNLSQSEMQQFSQLAEHDSALHQLLKASSVVDNTLADYSDSDLQLAPEIVSLDFELPMIPAEGITPLVTLTPEPIDDMLVAAAACAAPPAGGYHHRAGHRTDRTAGRAAGVQRRHCPRRPFPQRHPPRALPQRAGAQLPLVAARAHQWPQDLSVKKQHEQ